MVIKSSYSKTKLGQAFLLLALLGNFACEGPQSKYNTIDIKDPHAGSEYVYGNIGGPPIQANHQYQADQNAGARVNDIRDKMFGSPVGAEPGLTQGNPGQ
jgi:hypothetical protein